MVDLLSIAGPRLACEQSFLQIDLAALKKVPLVKRCSGWVNDEGISDDATKATARR